MPDLNDKQRAFVFHYLQSFNGTRAAIAAGYSEKTARFQASDLLTKPNIQALIHEKLNQVEITAFRVLGELSKIAYADMGDYGTVSAGGGFEPNSFEDLPIGATRAIKKIKEKKQIIDDNVANVQCEYELHDKLKALDLLGKHLGLWKEDQKTPEVGGGLKDLIKAIEQSGK